MALQIYRDLGNIPLILAHMGGWQQWDDAECLAAQTPFYLDTVYCLGQIVPLERRLWTHGSLDTMPQEQFLRFVKVFGAKRLLFGTDSPWRDQGHSLKAIQELPLSDEDKNTILGGNAVKLLGI